MATLEQNLLFAERQLEKHSYLAGDDFSLTDVQFGHVLYRYYSIDVVRQPLAKLRSYYDRLAEERLSGNTSWFPMKSYVFSPWPARL